MIEKDYVQQHSQLFSARRQLGLPQLELGKGAGNIQVNLFPRLAVDDKGCGHLSGRREQLLGRAPSTGSPTTASLLGIPVLVNDDAFWTVSSPLLHG